MDPSQNGSESPSSVRRKPNKDVAELYKQQIAKASPPPSPVVTGRARGIFHQYRVSRFIYRAEADYNRLSGVQRAKWLINTKIDP